MLAVPDLDLGSVDAINYQTNAQKEYFSKILYKESYLDSFLLANKYFVIGEKGAGKTSYAVFLNNSDYQNTLSKIVNLTQTDYRRFVNLKNEGKFDYSSYVDIWRVILLLLVSHSVCEKFPDSLLGFPLFRALKAAIDEYYKSAFRPEVDQSLDMVENSEVAAEIMAKHAKASAKTDSTTHKTTSSVQVNLSFLEKKFRDAISTVKLGRNFILFVDGVDIRPDKIDYESYIECIKGLANAVWEINTGFLANIKDRPFKIKIIVLFRPDILDNMGFQNLNAKVRDNSIVLDWITSYDQFASSKLFHLVAEY